MPTKDAASFTEGAQAPTEAWPTNPIAMIRSHWLRQQSPKAARAEGMIAAVRV